MGASVPANASSFQAERTAQAEQRETIEHLLGAIQQAAKKLTERLSGQAAHAERDAIRPALALSSDQPFNADAHSPSVLPLRDALLDLPPPTC